jgi:UDP-glucose 4-epimerase
MRVLVTGSSGRLARVLLPNLCAGPGIEEVHGVDLRPCGFRHPRFRQHLADVRSTSLAHHMRGCDAVLHLAFVVMRGSLGRLRHDRELVRSIDVGGSLNVARLAATTDVRHLIHLSSAAVYGAWPDNPARIGEAQPLRPMPGFAYSEDKAAVEQGLDAIEAQHPHLRIVRLRPHVILGPNAHGLLRFLLRQPFYPRLPEPQPLTQCVWEADVAAAVLAALHSPARGAFNLAAEPALSFRDMVRLAHPWALPVPYGFARALQRGLWRLSGVAGDPGWVDGMRYPLALDCGRAARELQWQARVSVYDCVQRVGGGDGRRHTV